MQEQILPTIVIFTDWYVPGFKAGGPVQSVYNLSVVLSENFHVKVVTRNTDLNSNDPYPGIVSNQWVKIGENHEVMYLSKDKTNFKYIKQIVKENTSNTIVINGLFSLYFSFLPALLCITYPVSKVFIAVRGMLHASALSVKPLKKQLFLAFARGFGLYQKPTLLATNEEEANEIKRVLGKTKMAIAPNIPMVYKPLESRAEKNAVFTIAFIGRIAPEKNPLTLIQALYSIKVPINVVFCGGSNNETYLNEFNNMLDKLPDNISKIYHPEMSHEQIQQLIKHTDLMVLPSLGENFGHAIYESLLGGVPVIIGNNTPWKNLESVMAGVEIEPKNEKVLTDAIMTFVSMDDTTYQLWREGANKKAHDYYSSNNFKQIYLDLFS